MPNSSKNTLSTQDVATALGVAETTVKRWADEGTIPCMRTPGGHRKFLLKDIVLFSEKNGYGMGGARPPRMEGSAMERLEFGVLARKFAPVAGVFSEEALRADRESILALLLYLYKHQIPLRTILDQVIQPAFALIGTMWKDGRLEINQEHAATAATLEALIRLAPELHRKESNGRSAVCACIEGELHELGLRGLAYALEVEGWRVFYLGANTPADTLGVLVHLAKPDMVCLSATAAGTGKELCARLQVLVEEMHANGGRVIAGGGHAAGLKEHGAGLDLIAQSIDEAVSYSRDVFNLKPGPRKRPDSTTKSHQ